jgi:hypothetical protein
MVRKAKKKLAKKTAKAVVKDIEKVVHGKKKAKKSKASKRAEKSKSLSKAIESGKAVSLVPLAPKPRGKRAGLKSLSGNPYLATMMNPFDITGVKCPDIVLPKSGTTQIRYVFRLTSLSAGDGGFIVYPRFKNFIFNLTAVAPGPESGDDSRPTTPQLSSKPNKKNAHCACGLTKDELACGIRRWCGQEDCPTVDFSPRASGDFTWSASDAPNYAADVAQIASFRPVSMGVKIQMITNATQDQGMFAAGWTPSIYTDTNQFLNWSTVLSLPFTTVGRVRNGAILIWRPESNVNFEFKDSTAATAMPGLFFVVNSCQASTVLLSVEVCANLEVLPQKAALNVINTTVDSPPYDYLRAAQDVMAGASTVVQGAVEALGSVPDVVDKVYNTAKKSYTLLQVGAHVATALGLKGVSNAHSARIGYKDEI